MNLKELLLDLLFPPLCFGCRRYHKSYLCEHCWQKIQINTSFFCPICQNRIPAMSLRAEQSPTATTRRGNLITTRPPCHLNTQYLLAPAADYRSEVVKNLIQELKFHRIASALEPIKKILDEYLSAVIATEHRALNALSARCSDGNPCGEPLDFAQDKQGRTINNFLIVPVPISSARLRERGFNQAQLIAEHVARQCKWQIANGNLIKIKDNKKQSELKNWAERKNNVENCFSLTQPELVKNKNIMLVDDVFTSGATINEAVKVLKGAGARKIIALVIARAR